MGGNIVKLVFETIAAGSGFAQVSAQTAELQKKLGKLSQGVQVLGQCFGNLGGIVGRGIGMLLQGGVWGAAATGIQLIIEKTGLFKKRIDESVSSLEELKNHFDLVNKKFTESVSAIDKETEAKKRQIEITKEMKKAELELAIAKAKASGKDSEAKKLSGQLANADSDATQKKDKLTVAQAEARLAAAKKQASGMIGWENGEFTFDKSDWNKRLRRAVGEIANARRAQTQQYEDSMHWNRTVAEDLYKPGEDLDERLEQAKNDKSALVERMKAAKKAAEDIAEAKKVLAEAKKVQATNEVKKAAVDVSAKVVEREEAVKKQQAEQKSKVADAQSTLHSAQSTFHSQFEQAFDLWRDPEAAAAAVSSDKKRSADLKNFNKAVNRFGGKGKIDEYAALMRAGDEEGMQARLDQWRKSSKFTPQAEMLVKAEAARQNESASDRALDKIEQNTAKLADKLDQLLSLK